MQKMRRRSINSEKGCVQMSFDMVMLHTHVYAATYELADNCTDATARVWRCIYCGVKQGTV